MSTQPFDFMGQDGEQDNPDDLMRGLAYAGHGLRRMFGGGGGGGAATQPSRQPKQQKPEDYARMENAGIDPMQAATAGFEAGAKHDKVASTLDSLAEFFGTLGGNPEVVQTARLNRQRRIDEMTNAAQTHALAAVGQQKLQEEHAKAYRETLDKNVGHILSASGKMDRPLALELASQLTDAEFSGDPTAVGRVLQSVGARVDDYTANYNETKGKQVGESESKDLTAAADQKRITDEELAKNTPAVGAAKAGVAGRVAGAETDARIRSKLKLTPAEVAQLRDANGQTPKGGAGGGSGPLANAGYFASGKSVSDYNKTVAAYKNVEGAYDKSREGQDYPRSGEQGAERFEQFKAAYADKSPEHALNTARQVIAAAGADPRALRPEMVAAVIPDLPPAERKLFMRDVNNMAVSMMKVNPKQAKALQDALVALSGSSATVGQ